MILPLLLQVAAPAAAPPADIVVSAPLKATQQTPATMVVEPVAMMIATFDEDGDGLVDRSEMLAGVRRSFEAIDTGHTGKLRYLAFADWAERWLGDRAALPSPFEVDRDGDDQITLTELQDQFSRLFARYDRNGDKRISRAELLTFRTRPVDGAGPARGGPPGKRPPRPDGVPAAPGSGEAPER